MTDTEFLQLLEDMASDEHPLDDCSIKEANLLERDAGSNRMPAYLKEEILTRVAQPDIQIVATPRKISKRMEFFLYSCRVTVAVAASLLLLFVASFSQSIVTPQQEANTQTQLDVTDAITDHFTNNSTAITGWLQSFPSRS